jgi:exodeoxyribonuclease VII large subunit
LAQVNISQNRWFFATLKDDQASVPVFSPLGRIPNWPVLEDGMRVRVDGWPKIYQKTGKFSLFARAIAPAGKGAIKEALEKLKQELATLGYFDPTRKRNLPMFVRRIGLITAPDSRAYSDFVSILNTQPAGIKVDLYPVLVQGEGAIEDIKGAFDFFNSYSDQYDLLVLTRGGGSLEDLLPFNNRVMAELVYGSRVPVLSAIGHEADECLIDLVADFRASTPTAAAQFINDHHQQVLLQVDGLASSIIDSYQELVGSRQEKAANLLNRLFVYYQGQFDQTQNLISRFGQSIDHYLLKVDNQKKLLSGLEKLLSSFDYRRVLHRGFTLTYGKDGKIITSLGQVDLEETINTRFYQGEIISQVKEKHD